MFCKKCGNQLNDGASFCPKCGTPTEGGTASKQSKGKSITKKKGFRIATIIFAVLTLIIIGSWVFFNYIYVTKATIGEYTVIVPGEFYLESNSDGNISFNSKEGNQSISVGFDINNNYDLADDKNKWLDAGWDADNLEILEIKKGDFKGIEIFPKDSYYYASVYMTNDSDVCRIQISSIMSSREEVKRIIKFIRINRH